MQARGPLMIEHRLIERMLEVVRREIGKIEKEGKVDPVFVDTAVDFIRVYADRTHHGKEEDILFRELAKKTLSARDKQVMDELVGEHIFGRRTVAALVAANGRYRRGDAAALPEITAALKTLAAFYPRHIDKDDDHLLPASRNYFSEAEDHAMLAEFYDFDRKMIHEKYTVLLDSLEKSG